MRPNILAGLGGLFGGAYEGYQQQRDYALRAAMEKAILAKNFGAGQGDPASSGPATTRVNANPDLDANGINTALFDSAPGANKLLAASAADSNMPTSPSDSATLAGRTSVGMPHMSPDTATDAGSVITARRAAGGQLAGGPFNPDESLTGIPGGGASGAHRMAPINVIGKGTPAPITSAAPNPIMAALTAAGQYGQGSPFAKTAASSAGGTAGQGVAGVGLPSAAPTSDPSDPMTAMQPFLDRTMALSKPSGRMDLGLDGLSVPTYSSSPEERETARSFLPTLTAAALQKSGQGFQAGQQSREFSQQTALATQRETLERDLASAHNAIEREGIQATIRRADAEMALLMQGRSDAETQKVVSDLKPMEDQLPTIAKFQAITPEMAKANPAAAQQAILEAFQVGMGGSTFPSRLAALAKTSTAVGPEKLAETFVSQLAGNRIPSSMFTQLQTEVATNKSALRKQHATMLAQDLAQYPIAASNPALAKRTDALFGPETAGSTDPRVATLQAQAAAAIKAGKDPDAVAAHLKQEIAGLR